MIAALAALWAVAVYVFFMWVESVGNERDRWS